MTIRQRHCTQRLRFGALADVCSVNVTDGGFLAVSNEILNGKLENFTKSEQFE